MGWYRTRLAQSSDWITLTPAEAPPAERPCATRSNSAGVVTVHCREEQYQVSPPGAPHVAGTTAVSAVARAMESTLRVNDFFRE